MPESEKLDPNQTDQTDAALLQRLAAESAIQRVIGDYGRGVDEGNWERVRRCFHEDATITYGSREARTRDDAIDWLARVTPSLYALSHYFGQAIVDLSEDGERAECETWCINVNQYPPGPDGTAKQHATGLLYQDVFERRDGSWKIASRRNLNEWTIEIDGNPRIPLPGAPDGS